MPVRSMTGFGEGTAALAEGRVVVELRSVNHRQLEVRVKAPKELGDPALFVEQLLRQKLSRGRIEATVRAEGVASLVTELDHARARDALRAFQALGRELGDTRGGLPWAALGGVPDLWVTRTRVEGEAVRVALGAAVDRALEVLDARRTAEGAELAIDLQTRLQVCEALLESIVQETDGSVDRLRERLTKRLAALLGEHPNGVESVRLEQEVALLAERSDVAEELTRLRAHFQHFEELLVEGTLVGRRMDFILQELTREANTLGAKTAEVGVSRRVIVMKSELERMREQVQNVE